MKKPVKFTLRTSPYNPGETAWFEASEADSLIERGCAVAVEAKESVEAKPEAKESRPQKTKELKPEKTK